MARYVLVGDITKPNTVLARFKHSKEYRDDEVVFGNSIGENDIIIIKQSAPDGVKYYKAFHADKQELIEIVHWRTNNGVAETTTFYNDFQGNWYDEKHLAFKCPFNPEEAIIIYQDICTKKAWEEVRRMLEEKRIDNG
jgi:hypothetical protein